MSNPSSSAFRNALQVSPERIANLSDVHLSELMLDLLRAQAHRCGSPLSEVRINTQDKAKDDGCDGWTSEPVTEDEWLGQTDTCWQLKAGTSGSPARLRGEVGKPLPRQTLQAGGRFVVVAPGSSNGKKGVDDRLKTLIDEAERAGIATGRIEVIGSEGLALWCNQNPAVAARWAGRPEGLWTLSDWANAEVHQVPWQDRDSFQEKIAQLCVDLDFEAGSVLHLHIHGQPAVGKTRFALELCRAAPWSSSVVYLRQASDIRLVEFIDAAAMDATVRLVLVADEIQRNEMLPLRDSVGRADGRIRLVTIGHCSTPEPARIPDFLVGPIEREVAVKLIAGWYPSMPFEHVDFVARFAGGYVRLAKLAADAVASGMEVDIRGLLSRQEIRGFLDGMLGTHDRRALYVVAVLENVGWTGDVQIEGEAIAHHLGLDWNDVRARVDEFDRIYGIVPRGGRYRYISPTPLSIHLAIEAWEIFPDLLRSLPDALPTEAAKDEYYKRLRAMASNPDARAYAQNELLSFVRLDHFLDPRAVRRWSSLVVADPSQAACNILRALESKAPSGQVRIKDDARRELVSTLLQLAWRSDAFFDAAKALALLAEFENEHWSNNATSGFLGLFQIFLGGTSVPYSERLAVIDELVTSERTPFVRLATKALAQIGKRKCFRNISEPISGEMPEKEWYPSTESEHLESMLAAINRLTDIASLGITELGSDLILAAKDLSTMLRNSSVRCELARFFEAIRAAHPEAREPLRRVISEVIFRERKYFQEISEESISELERLCARFEDGSLPGRLRQVVGVSHWSEDEQPDLRPLARELVESPSTFAEMWPWFTSGDAADGLRLGEALAAADSDNLLLETMLTAESAGRDLRILSGYVSVFKAVKGDEWFDDWMLTQTQRSPRPLNVVFEVTRRCGATPTVARCLREILMDEPVAPEVVGQLSYGLWGENLPLDILTELVRAMINAGHEATALIILERRTQSRPEEHEAWLDLSLELIAVPNLIRSGYMVSYYWKELALRYVEDRPIEIADVIAREQGIRSIDTWFLKHSEAEKVLEACMERTPEGVWDLITPHLSSKAGAAMFCIGFPRGVVDKGPLQQVMAWVDADPDNRASIIAKLASKDFANDDTLASRLVGSYGDREDVARAFFSEYVSGSWVGSASAHWEELAISSEEIANRTALPKLRRWATRAARDLRQMGERDRQREEEEYLRGR